MKKQTLSLLTILSAGASCFLRQPLPPQTLCSDVDADFDGEIDYLICSDGCFLYDADGDLGRDDRVCQDPFSGCATLDIDADSVIEQSDCAGATGCSLTDADLDGESDDTFCIKAQGCFVVDLNSDGIVDQDNCLSCISWEPAELLLSGDVLSDCQGEMFASFHSGYQLFVGVILCDSDNYKLLLSSSLEGPYFNIGDAAGHGQDHCELVNPNFYLLDDDDITSGGCVTCDVGPGFALGGGAGFIRSSFGEGFSFDPSWIPNYLTSGVYSCGISLPSVNEGCTPSPECKQIDRSGDGLPDTFDCSAVNGCIASDFNQDNTIDAVVCVEPP